jgi:hypothetical protein
MVSYLRCREQPIRVMGRAWTVKNDAGFVCTSVQLGENAVVGKLSAEDVQSVRVPEAVTMCCATLSHYVANTDELRLVALLSGSVSCTHTHSVYGTVPGHSHRSSTDFATERVVSVLQVRASGVISLPTGPTYCTHASRMDVVRTCMGRCSSRRAIFSHTTDL